MSECFLVTGGAGFIGSNFINHMLKKYGEKIFIINVDKLTYAGNTNNLLGLEDCPNYLFIKADICDKSEIGRIFDKYSIDCVVNFAAETHVDQSIESPEAFVATNVLGTQVLLDCARKSWETARGFKTGKKYIQISTDEVYGSLDREGYFTENTPLDPRSPYSASKASADFLVKAYYYTYKMPINITRCSNNYGPYQFPEKLIPLIINNCLEDKALPVYGDGKNIRDWLYVEDHCRAIDTVIRNGIIGQIYNIGGHSEKANIEVVRTLIKLVREMLPETDTRKALINDGLIKYVEDRKGHDRRYAIDYNKIKNELGWEPQVRFEDGISKTVMWYLNNEAWLRKSTERLK